MCGPANRDHKGGFMPTTKRNIAFFGPRVSWDHFVERKMGACSGRVEYSATRQRLETESEVVRFFKNPDQARGLVFDSVLIDESYDLNKVRSVIGPYCNRG
jgi:hypothetical protein